MDNKHSCSNFLGLTVVRKKNEKTPWSQINPTIVHIDPKACFKVGKISKEDKIIESNELNAKHECIKAPQYKKSEYLKTYKPSFTLLDNINKLERIMLETDFKVKNDLTIKKITGFIDDTNDNNDKI